MKIVVVGGVAAGASAAARARRVNDEADIVLFERGDYVSFASCGLPYYVGGVIENRGELLLVTPQMFKARFNIDVRVGHEVISIDRTRKTVSVAARGDVFEERYDKLILALGGDPVTPDIEGAALAHTAFTLPDVDDIAEKIGSGVTGAIVVGGGSIGLEMAEALINRGIGTTLVELQPRLLGTFDSEFSVPLERRLADGGIRLLLGRSIRAIRTEEGAARRVLLSDGSELTADLVIIAVGVRPRTSLAEDAGLALGVTGGLCVDPSMRTSDPDIFAAGDMVESVNLVSGKPVRIPLAGSANRQGRVAGTNAAGGDMSFRGVLGTSIIKIFDLTAARTGMSEREAAADGFDCYSIYAPAASHASYYPGAGWLILKLTASRGGGRLLGAQAIGNAGVDKRIDVISTAICAGMTVTDLENLDLAYAPPYSAAKDPVNMAGMIASNVLRGDVKIVTPGQLPAFLRERGAVLVDIRAPDEFTGGAIDGAIAITLDSLRADPDQLDKSKTYVLYCGVGYRGYIACRFLAPRGYDVYNLTGGYNSYIMDV
jgi:NADPH-dependent 2,4-dienoyl-CoA reductase/sulfur reductase-like enzyme/rhodanese-related sulfurtransferase